MRKDETEEKLMSLSVTSLHPVECRPITVKAHSQLSVDCRFSSVIRTATNQSITNEITVWSKLLDEEFYILLTVNPVMIHGNWPTWRAILFYVFISFLYLFRVTSCSSSGESVLSIQPLVYVTLCRWPFRVQVGHDLHTKRSPTQSDIYQRLYCYNWFFWWRARSCSKHVEQRFTNFFQVGTTFISQNVLRTTLLLGLSNSLGLP